MANQGASKDCIYTHIHVCIYIHMSTYIHTQKQQKIRMCTHARANQGAPENSLFFSPSDDKTILKPPKSAVIALFPAEVRPTYTKASWISRPVQTIIYYAQATISRLRKKYVSFAKEPCKRDDILQKSPMCLRSLLIIGTLLLYP